MIDNKTNKKDISNRTDIDQLIADFYQSMLKDPIIGFIFTDVAKIELEHHLPIVCDFWDDVLFKGSLHNQKKYQGNALQAHLDLHFKMPLTPGHFTRWLFLFSKAIDNNFAGKYADLAKQRAELVAKSISAKIAGRSKSELDLVLR